MTAPQYTPATLTDAHRERIVQVLSAAFATDRLSMEQLDERLSGVYRAQTLSDLELLLSDPADPARSLAQETEAPRRIAADPVVAERGVAMAVMGGFERKGPWIVPRHMRVTAVMGGGSLDLRQARLAQGVTEIEIFAFWGGVEIIVPAGVRVETVGMAFMGGFSINGGDVSDDPNLPVLRISGIAIMGGVDVRYRDRTKKAEKRYIQALERAQRLRGGK
jgi:hypothetical protein